MDRVVLSDEYMKIEGHYSSKGNQWKWREDNYWYKADQLGYETLAETVVSHILQHSTIENLVIYEPVILQYKEKELIGCRSKSFLGDRQELVTLEKLFRQHIGMSLSKELSYFFDIKKKINYTV